MQHIRYARHAIERMRQRGISQSDVKRALSLQIGQPQPGEPGSMWIRGYAVGGRILKVCVRTDDRNYVITAVWPG